MDLRERLARLDRLAGKRRPARPAVEPVRPRPAVLDLGLEPAFPGGEPGVLSGRWACALPAASFTGRDLEGLFTTAPAADLRRQDLLFLDLETTGLAGGTGTLAFLAGLGWWEGDDFVVQQLLLTDPDCEDRLLDLILRAAAGKRAVVTYNGGCFDLPLLRTRALVNRRRVFLDQLASLDLVVPARRFWSRSLPDCRQQTLETLICGQQRGPGDIEGRDIPGVWFAFLQGEDDGRLAAVLRHNRRDMRGMAGIWNALLAWLAVADGTLPASACDMPLSWSQAWSLARISDGRGRPDRVAWWLARTLDLLDRVPCAQAPSAVDRGGFWLDAVRMAKRHRRWPLLERIIAAGLAAGGHVPWLHHEAAILYEHRLGDLDKALLHAVSCRQERRIQRLTGKLGSRPG